MSAPFFCERAMSALKFGYEKPKAENIQQNMKHNYLPAGIVGKVNSFMKIGC